jgi:hypothetical protein
MAQLNTITLNNTTTGAASSNPCPVNWISGDFGIGLGFNVTASKGASCDVEYTFDDPKGTLTDWYKHTAMSNMTASAQGNIAFPVTAIRLVMTAATITGAIGVLKVVQG